MWSAQVFNHLLSYLMRYYMIRSFSNISFGAFVLWHINLCRLFNAKAILQEEQ